MVEKMGNTIRKGGTSLPSVSNPKTMTFKEFDTTMVHIRTSCFTEREFAQIKGFLLEEDGDVPSRKAIGDLFNLTRDLMQKMAYQLREAKGERAKAESQLLKKDAEIEDLKKQLAELSEKINDESETNQNDCAPQISEMGLDSVDLAKAICYRSKMNGHILYRNQMQAMMYIVYGKALARKGARITKEHPQAWEFGPVFPRAYSKVRETADDAYREQSELLKAQSPEVSRLIDETVSRCSWRGCRELLATLVTHGSPCDWSRRRNPEKKTAPMEDAEIREWFSSRK